MKNKIIFEFSDDQDRKEYYEALNEMFSTKGWKLFQEDVQRDHDNVSSIDGVNSMEDLFSRIGQRRITSAYLKYEELARQALEQLDADNS